MRDHRRLLAAVLLAAALATLPLSGCGPGAAPTPAPATAVPDTPAPEATDVPPTEEPTPMPSPTTAPPPTATPAPEPTEEEGGPAMPFEITSPAFAPQASIPQQYTCDGQDISPPLSWSDPPQATEGFALICDDPDAPVGTWVHWVLFNIPADSRTLPEGVPAQDQLSDGSLHGTNGWGRRDYGGPCPPSGTHRYFFKLYALDTMVDLPAGATKEDVIGAIEGHILAQAELMGTYAR